MGMGRQDPMVGPNCQTLILGHRLSRQMPDLFPPEIYDELDPRNPRSRVLRQALSKKPEDRFASCTEFQFQGIHYARTYPYADWLVVMANGAPLAPGRDPFSCSERNGDGVS